MASSTSVSFDPSLDAFAIVSRGEFAFAYSFGFLGLRLGRLGRLWRANFAEHRSVKFGGGGRIRTAE